MSLVAELADRAHAIAEDDVPESVLATTRVHLADTVAALAAGHATLHGTVEPLADALGLPAASGTPGSARRTAFVGGAYAHCWEAEGIHRETVLLPGCVVLPAALAVLPCTEPTWGRLLRCYLAGYEVALGVARAVRGDRLIRRGWWPTALLAPLGAATTVSLLLGQSPRTTASAIALAAQQAGGVVAGSPDGANGRYLLAAAAAERAITSVLAADANWGGPLDILEDPRSPLHRDDPPADTGGDFLLPRTSLKAHSGAKHLQAAIDAVLSLRAETTDWDLAAVRDITCWLPAQLAGVVDRPPPFRSPLSALASAQFVLGVSALRGRCAPWDVEPAVLRDERLVSLAHRIRVSPAADADDLSRRYPASWGARVAVTTTSGTRQAERADARGDPGAELTNAEVTDKFVLLAGRSLGADRAGKLVSALLGADLDAAPDELTGHVIPLLGQGDSR